MLCPSCGAPSDTAIDSCLECGRSLYGLTKGHVLASRYEIRTLLGKGGMGIVYKAHDRELDEDVAIKVLRMDIPSSGDLARRFRSEIKLARRVRHRNVCGIHEYGQDGHIRFIAMEFIEGVDLKQLLRGEGPLPPVEARSVIVQVASGLEAIHQMGIVHRDLKTANIMRDRNGVIRLMDFGLAKRFEAETAGATAAGHVVGTPEYMSPEQARGLRVDQRSDIYALGIILYELLTGNVPFHTDSPLATMLQHIQALPPLEGPPAVRIPPALVPTLARALAKSPDRRFQSALEMMEALSAARIDLVAAPILETSPLPRDKSVVATPSVPNPMVATAVPELDPTPTKVPVLARHPTPTPVDLETIVPTTGATAIQVDASEPSPRRGLPKWVGRSLLAGAVVLSLAGGLLWFAGNDRVDSPREATSVASQSVAPRELAPATRETGPAAQQPLAPALQSPAATAIELHAPRASTSRATDSETVPPASGRSRAPSPPSKAAGHPDSRLDLRPTPVTIARPATRPPETKPSPLTTPPSSHPAASASPTSALVPPPTPAVGAAAFRPVESEVRLVPRRGPTLAPPLVMPSIAPTAAAVPGASSSPASVAASRPATSAPGTLALKARPWAEVMLDGNPVGRTPLLKLSLSPGPHVVVMSHPDYEPFRRVVQIKPGENVTLTVDLRDEAVRRKR